LKGEIMSINILNKKGMKLEQIKAKKVIGDNGNEEIELIINLEGKLFKRLGYRPTLELKSIIIPGVNNFPLTINMLLVNRDYKLLFDSVWNFQEEESRFFYEAMKSQDKIKVVFINSENGLEKVEKVKNELKKVFREYIKTLNTLKQNVKDFDSSVKAYESKMNKKDLWNSPLIEIMMGKLGAIYELNKNQVIEGNLIHCAIHKSEVSNLDFDRINEAIEVFEECGKKARGKLVITFDGYENTQLEIFEIQDIRNYVEKMFKNHNNLFYFLSNEQNSNKSILACLVETKKTQTNGSIMNMQINLRNRLTNEIALGFIDYANKCDDVSMESLELLFSITHDNKYTHQSIFIKTKLEELAGQLTNCNELTKDKSCVQNNNYEESSNRPIILHQWTEECNDPKEECNYDFVYKLLMPNGEIKEERCHFY
jgi:hypothetical protein